MMICNFIGHAQRILLMKITASCGSGLAFPNTDCRDYRHHTQNIYSATYSAPKGLIGRRQQIEAPSIQHLHGRLFNGECTAPS